MLAGSFSSRALDPRVDEILPLAASEMKNARARDGRGTRNARSRISKIIRMCGISRIRSFDGRVSSRLSSITEFIFSIQLASRSPSRMIQPLPFSGAFARSRIVDESSPSFHSRVARLT